MVNSKDTIQYNAVYVIDNSVNALYFENQNKSCNSFTHVRINLVTSVRVCVGG